MRGRGRTRSTMQNGSVVEMPVRDIRVGQRHRKDMGDLKGLARSIEEHGLLQPVGVTEDMVLVFGERRLLAVSDILKRRTIAARVVSIRSIVAGEYVENEVRKNFTPSERVAIAEALEQEVPERRGRPGKNRHHDDTFHPGRTDDRVAELTGFESRQSYRQAKKVVERGSSKLIVAMDEGRVSITAAALLAEAVPDEQDAILELDEQAVLRAAKEIRQRRTAYRNGQQRADEQRARSKLNGQQEWKITGDQRVVRCDLLLADPAQRVDDVMTPAIRRITPDVPASAVAQCMSEYNLMAVPVIDDQGRLLGVVSVDDAVEVILPDELRRRIPRVFS